MKKLALIFSLSFLTAVNLFGQDQSKDVTITISSSGKTQEKATQNALRSAIEKAFGTFISAKTEILNDELISDEITSIASGNIKSYEVLNASELPNGNWGVTLKSVVSVDKLTSFVQAKGVEVEIKGGFFAMNIKQQLLNEQAEVDVVADMFGVLHEVLQTAFDYRIETSDPVSVDDKSENWKIPISISVVNNDNMDFCANYCINILNKISLTSDEKESYSKLGKKVYNYGVFYNNKYHEFSFRKKNSVEILDMIKQMMFTFYPFRFMIDSGLDSLNGNEILRIHSERYKERYNEGCDQCSNEFLSTFFWDKKDWLYSAINKETLLLHIKDPRRPDYMVLDEFFRGSYLRGYLVEYNKGFIVFQNSNQTAAKFTFPDHRSLKEIEQLSQYSVQPVQDHSLFKYGGFVVYDKDGQGLICAPFDLGELELDNANDACENFVLNGYNDWYLPSRMDLYHIALNLSYLGIGVFHMNEEYYWSNEIGEYELPWIFSFRLGWKQKSRSGLQEQEVRPVRRF